MAPTSPPSLDRFEGERVALQPWIRETPVVRWSGGGEELARWALKLELFQVTGSFKPRGAFAVMRRMAASQRAQGVVAVSAGNHAMAVAHAARILGSEAKVFMPSNASPFRVAAARALGAEVVLASDVHDAFAAAEDAVAREGRFFVHPFEGEHLALGTGTLGLEIVGQVPDIEAVVVPIGGGGLCAGVATAVKQARPRCAVYGVEPEGADTMRRSFAAGRPVGIDAVRTIADSLGAPHAAPYSFELCRHCSATTTSVR